jgi:hypothetical protein
MSQNEWCWGSLQFEIGTRGMGSLKLSICLMFLFPFKLEHGVGTLASTSSSWRLCKSRYHLYGAFHYEIVCSCFMIVMEIKTRDRESEEKLREVDGRKAHSSREPSPSSTRAAKKDICIILREWNIWECRIQRSLEADVPFHFLADIRGIVRWWEPAIGSNL